MFVILMCTRNCTHNNDVQQFALLLQAAFEREVQRIRRDHMEQGLLVARHPLQLASAYPSVTGSEPSFTTCHLKAIDTVSRATAHTYSCLIIQV